MNRAHRHPRVVILLLLVPALLSPALAASEGTDAYDRCVETCSAHVTPEAQACVPDAFPATPDTHDPFGGGNADDPPPVAQPTCEAGIEACERACDTWAG